MAVGVAKKTLGERRATTEITVLRRIEGWTNEDLPKLSGGLKTAVVRDPDKCPRFLLIRGDHSRERIARLLEVHPADFDHHLVIGMDNPSLPFKPSFQPSV